jgi:hypothetical protein
MIRACVHCDEDFDDRLPHNQKGKINECGRCARDVIKYVGTMDAAAKSGSGINIFRKPTEISIASAVIKSQNRAGFNANLGLGSTTSTFGEGHDI